MGPQQAYPAARSIEPEVCQWYLRPVGLVRVPLAWKSCSAVTVLHCRIPTELHHRLRHLMVDEGTSVTALVIDFLEAGLQQRGR